MPDEAALRLQRKRHSVWFEVQKAALAGEVDADESSSNGFLLSNRDERRDGKNF